MKKYITIVALLAAGSAFANAEATIVSATLTDDNKATYSLEDVGTYWAVQFQINTAFYSSAFISLTSATDSLPALQVFSQNSTYIGINNTNNADYTHWICDSNNNSTALGTETIPEIAFTVVNNGGEISLWTTDNAGNSEQRYLRWGTNPNQATGSASQTLSDADSYYATTLANEISLAAGKDYFDFVTVAKFDAGQDLSTLVKSMYNIPEPSAFGLLAGLGALALVGTRRRRR